MCVSILSAQHYHLFSLSMLLDARQLKRRRLTDTFAFASRHSFIIPSAHTGVLPLVYMISRRHREPVAALLLMILIQKNVIIVLLRFLVGSLLTRDSILLTRECRRAKIHVSSSGPANSRHIHYATFSYSCSFAIVESVLLPMMATTIEKRK